MAITNLTIGAGATAMSDEALRQQTITAVADRNQKIDLYDPPGIFSALKSQYGYGLGFGSVFGKDCFFLEMQGRDGATYVLTFTPQPSDPSAPNAGYEFVTQVYTKDGQGVLREARAAYFQGEASEFSLLRQGSMDASLAGAAKVIERFQAFCDVAAADRPSLTTFAGAGTSPSVHSSFVLTGVSELDRGEHGTYYTGWANCPDTAGDPFYDRTREGSVGYSDGVGGFGCSWVFKPETGRGHWVTTYEAYERALAGVTDDSYFTFTRMTDHKGELGNNQWWGWAEKNGVSIFKAQVNTDDGRTLETTGMSFTRAGYTYSFVWDQQAEVHRLAKVTDASGADVTDKALKLQVWQDFGRSLQQIEQNLVLVTADPGVGGVAALDDDFSVTSTSGSAESPTDAEVSAYEAFKIRWADYITAATGTLTELPNSDEDKKALLEDLKKLNATHVMLLFTGGETAQVGRLSLLTDLLKVGGTAAENANKIAEWLGKLSYLVGRELARGENDDQTQSMTSALKNDFWHALQKQIDDQLKEVSSLVMASDLSARAKRDVLYNFMLGLRNYTEGKIDASMLTPEKVVLYLAERLQEAAAGGQGSLNRATANEIIKFSKGVLDSLSRFMGIDGSLDFYGYATQGGSSTGGIRQSLFTMLSSTAAQESSQKLLTLFFGAMGAHAWQSPEAQQAFEAARKAAQTESVRLNEALLALMQRLMDIYAQAIRQTVGN